jgi:uncharacterized protein YndB with AHSA1/START domain
MQKINTKAPVQCSKSIIINAGPEIVWSILTGINQWPDWQNDISSSRLNGKLEAGTSFDWKSGGLSIHSVLHTVNPEKKIGWSGKSLGIFAIHNWTLINIDGKTEVHVEESMEGWPARLFKKPLNKTLDNGMQVWLDLLKKESEKGRI